MIEQYTILLWGFRLFVLFVAGTTAFLCYRAWQEWQAITQIGASGVRADAEIIDRRTRQGSQQNLGNNRSYFGTFRFRHEGDTFEVEQRVGRKTYSMLRPGEKVRIRYVAEKPHIARLDGPHLDYTARTSLTMSAGAGLVITLFIVAMFAQSIF